MILTISLTSNRIILTCRINHLCIPSRYLCHPNIWKDKTCFRARNISQRSSSTRHLRVTWSTQKTTSMIIVLTKMWLRIIKMCVLKIANQILTSQIIHQIMNKMIKMPNSKTIRRVMRRLRILSFRCRFSLKRSTMTSPSRPRTTASLSTIVGPPSAWNSRPSIL